LALGAIMAWIQTFSGKRFFPMAPRPQDLDIRDVAHSLSMQCRFNGHCRAFYCVAQHCELVSRILPPQKALWGLLHDAAEAYLSDLPRPVKQQLPMFEQAEERLLEVIARHFGLVWPMPEAVKRADDILLMTELRDLMEPVPEPWRIDAKPLDERIEPVSPGRAETMFLERFEQLRSAPGLAT